MWCTASTTSTRTTDVARAPDPLVVQPASAVMTVSDTSPSPPRLTSTPCAGASAPLAIWDPGRSCFGGSGSSGGGVGRSSWCHVVARSWSSSPSAGWWWTPGLSSWGLVAGWSPVAAVGQPAAGSWSVPVELAGEGRCSERLGVAVAPSPRPRDNSGGSRYDWQRGTALRAGRSDGSVRINLTIRPSSILTTSRGPRRLRRSPLDPRVRS